ncbi:MAG: sigma 54-interacting transcriptional regulator [Lysobacterales bacterium]|nr:sigma 54-interacting transcriptional regulator [Xanthomonadales bacterium]MCB1612889.1 sigma 54-interacting transcriptional regulator [Xanthomonadales bacterium]MCP5476518.1 sigma 54-interacting transcriptional regulator [Rhodanobacteraceae bacterium]
MSIRYKLEWLDSTQPRRDLAPGRYRLGRGGDSDLLIEAAGVSREHAELVVCADRGVIVRDLGSTNGTRVDGVRIDHGAYSGDIELQLGSARLRLRERVGGLDQLAFVVSGDAPDATAPDPPDPAADLDTALHDLGRELQQSILEWSAPPVQGRDLGRLLQGWVAAPGIRQLQLRRASDQILVAQAGLGDAAALECIARTEAFELWAELESDLARRALTRLGEEMLRWAAPAAAVDAGAVAHSTTQPEGLPSADPDMCVLVKQLARAARARVPVLLLGETGVGKELLARWVHQQSPRADRPFLALNCAALSRELLEAELFGVERGAATGVEARPGLFERADGGTLFLDEIGDTAADTQVRLLRVLEAGEVLRVGARVPTRIDVRVIAATHRDLPADIAAGRFRLDLFHRIAGFSARVPPLRQRSVDIAPLAIHFFQAALARHQRHSPGITAAALLALQRWSWPGNVRELKQAIEHAVIVLDEGEALDREHLPEGIRGEPAALPDLSLDGAVARAEREALISALALSGGQAESAWTLLGIGKTSFYKKLKEHRLSRPGTDGESP